MHHNTKNVGGGASDVVQLAGGTRNSARCAVSSTGVLWRQGVAEFAVPGIDEWSVIDTKIGVMVQAWVGQKHLKRDI